MIRKVNHSEIDKIADFMHWANSLPEQYSGYCSVNKEIILKDLEQGLINQTDLIVASFREGAVEGVMTAHFGSDNQSADCCGPYIKNSDLKLAEALFEALLTHLPRPMALQFFFSEKNQVCLELMQKQGAINQGSEWIMEMNREQFRKMPQADHLHAIMPLNDAQRQDFADLHDTIFPESYVKGKQILQTMGTSRKVYILEKEGIIRGYGVLRFAAMAKTVAAEIIAVRQEDRGHGYGKDIMTKLIDEAFQQVTINAVELVVESDNTAAIGLYKKLGFTVKTVNCSYMCQMRDTSGGSR